MANLSLHINDQAVGPVEIAPEVTMIEFLHEYLNLTGTKFGCGIGVCHACVIIVENDDGTLATERSCISNALMFNGKRVRTIEGHATRNQNDQVIALHPAQQAFIEHFAFQCGWCTPGFLNETIALVDRLKRNPVPKASLETVIEEALSEHICRCTGYVKYYEAIKDLIESTEHTTI